MIRNNEAGGEAKHRQIEISSQDFNVKADDHREPIQGRMLNLSFLSTLKSLSRGKHKEEGDLGEADLSKWFAVSGLAYVAICQAKETFSPLFTAQVKRPDFLVLLDSIGLIAVDAKNFKTSH